MMKHVPTASIGIAKYRFSTPGISGVDKRRDGEEGVSNFESTKLISDRMISSNLNCNMYWNP
jgi:hypothetical protein